jgi:hypothetical protein
LIFLINDINLFNLLIKSSESSTNILGLFANVLTSSELDNLKSLEIRKLNIFKFIFLNISAVISNVPVDIKEII